MIYSSVPHQMCPERPSWSNPTRARAKRWRWRIRARTNIPTNPASISFPESHRSRTHRYTLPILFLMECHTRSTIVLLRTCKGWACKLGLTNSHLHYMDKKFRKYFWNPRLLSVKANKFAMRGFIELIFFIYVVQVEVWKLIIFGFNRKCVGQNEIWYLNQTYRDL